MNPEPEEENPDLLAGVFKILIDHMKQHQPYIFEKEKVCPHCDTGLSDVRATGRLGCPHCYEAFGEELDYFFTQAQHGNQHVGKQQPTNTRNTELAELENHLQEAIKKEDYEMAAVLRDKIKQYKG